MSRRGMTLFECLVCCAILVVTLNIMMSAFVQSGRLQALGTQALDRLRMVSEVRDGVLGSMRGAARVVPAVGAYATGENQVVLELPPSPEDGATRYIVIGYAPEAKRLWRLVAARHGEQYDIESFFHYALPLAGARFDYGPDGPARARRITLHLDAESASRRNQGRVPYRVVAALRCDGGPAL